MSSPVPPPWIKGERMSLVTIDPELCRKDGLCVRVCQKVFSQKTKDSVPEVVHEESCNSCGHCVLICPSGAIRQRNCPPESIHRVQGGLIPSYEQVREMIVSRRSTRTFYERTVERDVIEKVIDGARFAPSTKNTQSTQFIVVRDRDLLRAIAQTTAEWLGKIAGRLKNPAWRKFYLLLGATKDEGEVKRWVIQFDDIAERMRGNIDLVLYHAPALILFHADKRIRFANENANLAVQNSTLTACSLGLGSFYTGYVVLAFNRDRTMAKLLPLPEKHRVYGGLALGYPGVRFSQWIERNPAKITWL
jgi:nitroreductase/NAD-dependent dihydropyrimidine dehydrogenase PreA subunit